MAHYLLDTCILVDYFRGNEKAAQFLEEFENLPFLSALTIAELYAGVREGKERALLDKLIQYFPIIPLDNEAAIKGGLYRRQYGIGIVDALLASSAEGKNLILATCNVKHFPMIKNVHCPY